MVNEVWSSVLFQALSEVKNLYLKKKKQNLAGPDISKLLDTNESRDSDVHNQQDCPLWRHGDNPVCVVILISCGRTQTFAVDTNKNLLEKAALKIVSSVWQTL